MSTYDQRISTARMAPIPSVYRGVWAGLRDPRRWPSIRMCTSAVQVFGELDVELLQRCILNMVRRHDALRMRVIDEGSGPVFVVSPEPVLHFELVDVSSQTRAQDPDELINEFCGRQIDVFVDHLFAVGLFRIAANDHILILAMDHLIVDGRSLGILEQEVWSEYCNLSSDATSAPAETLIQFTDYLLWREENKDDWRQQHLPYWKQYLEGVSALRIPRSAGCHPEATLSRALEHGQDGVIMELPLGADICEGMQVYARQRRIALSMVAMTIHSLSVAGWCKVNDFPMTFVSDARYDGSLQNTVGFLAEHLVLRIELREEESFTELVRRLKADLYQALRHGGGNHLVDSLSELGIGRLEAYFNWSLVDVHQFEAVTSKTGGKLRLKYRVARPAVPSGFLPIYLRMGEAIHLLVYHRPEVVSGDLVRSFFEHMTEVARRVLSRPDLPIHDSLAGRHLNWGSAQRAHRDPMP